jgi:competence protein ComEA
VLRELRDWVEELACRAGFDGLPSTGRAAAWTVAAVVVCMAGTLWWSGAFRSGGDAGSPGIVAGTADPVSAEAMRGGGPAVVATVTVHVVGEVRRPGVYELAGGSRAADAVAAAGGLLGAADQAAVNLARVVADGEQIAVPRQGEGGGAGAAAGPGPGARPPKIDLNTASEAQLDTLPGVGPATASKIVSDRTENGPYRTVDDLLRVPGIGPSKFDALKDLVTTG